MNNQVTNTINARATTQLKDRVSAIKEQLKNVGLKNIVLIITNHFPEYNTIEGGRIIDQVYYGRRADINLTEILEQIASGELK